MSTQLLTELPRIQKTGMDYNTVLQEMKNIINDNPKWKDNWSEFYESEAGTMFMSLFSWLADNINTRQDLLINEMFIGTAQDDSNKIKHLKKIGYIPKMAHSSKVPIRIVLDKVADSPIILTKSFNKLTDSFADRPSKIFRFNDKDINGKDITWEVLNLKNGEIDYQGQVSLSSGKIEYIKKDAGKNKDDETLFAIQGKTVYEEFTTLTSDGPYFDLKEKNIASDSIQVFLKSIDESGETNNIGERIEESKSFLFSSNKLSYVLEMNNDRSFRIRFANKSIGRNKPMLKAGSTISVFYRVCDGELGNIKPNYMSPSTELIDESGTAYEANIYNDFPAVGGSNQEDLKEAVRNGPLKLTTMDRAVTPDDYNIILDNNTNILKSKTYTATNQPLNFKDYYGRYINPQEAFIFTMINKNHEGVPTDKYNYFPWITSLKETRINEKYIFDKGAFNSETKLSPTVYDLNVTIKAGDVQHFNNATVINVGDEFNNDFGKEDMELKLSSKKIKDLFFKNVSFDILESDLESSKLLEFNKDTKVLKADDFARFITNEEFELSAPIDIKENRLLNFVLNDEVEVKVDLFNETLFDNNIEKAYLLWDNDSTEGDKYKNDPTKEAAKHRPGIVQLINETINTAMNSIDEKYKYINRTSKQYASWNKNNKEEPLATNIQRFSLQMGDNICIFESTEPITNITDLCNFLNDSFIGNTYFVKNPEGTYTQGSGELANYEAAVISRKNTSQQQDGVIINNTLNVYDLIIFNRDNNIKVLKDGYIKVSDPLVSIIKEANIYEGLFKLLGTNNLEPATKYVDYNYSPASILKEEESEFGRLYIKTPEEGHSQNIYFFVENYDLDFGNKILKIIFNKENKSYKSYGERKAYLMPEDSITTNSAKIPKVFKGNVIFENSCMFNSYDFSEVFAHYKLASEPKLEIGSSYDNFFYSGLDSDKLMKSKVYGIFGQKTNSDGIIDDNISKYDIRLTKEEADTNSLFAINNDLGAVENDYVEFETNTIVPGGIGKISFDIGDNNMFNININSVSSCYDLLLKIKAAAKAYSEIYKGFDNYFELSYTDSNKLVFRSLYKDPSKCITFYNENTNSDAYKWLFGTNKTNKKFYDLYPEADFKGHIEYIDEGQTEYYYAPKTDNPLKLYFRKMVDGVSRPYDYNISSSYEEDKNEYHFYIEKNNVNGLFPDNYFYLHFINDKTLYKESENGLNTDDEILQSYMQKYKVSGTDIVFLQPYFRTYDIAVTITYNPSYSKDVVENSVREAIQSLCGLSNAIISGRMSKSKIYKAISSCNGIIDSYISYFGFDILGNSEKDKSRENIISDFFEVCLLHETTATGKGLTINMSEGN